MLFLYLQIKMENTLEDELTQLRNKIARHKLYIKKTRENWKEKYKSLIMHIPKDLWGKIHYDCSIKKKKIHPSLISVLREHYENVKTPTNNENL